MNVLNYLEIVAAVAGLTVSGLVFAFPRFGVRSWLMGSILVPAVLSSAIQGIAPAVHWLPEDAVLLSFVCLILCAATGCVASYIFKRADFRADLNKYRWFFGIIIASAPALIAGLYVFRPPLASSTQDLIALGTAGYGGAVYLLFISVVILANVQQTLREVEGRVRWELKFLLLGIALIFAAIIYIAARVLLYPPEYSFLPLEALRLFPIMLLCASMLILQSWRRTGNGVIVPPLCANPRK